MSDLISRQAAIDAALTFIVEYCGAAFDEDMQKMLCERLDDLPSVEPKKGHWVGLGEYPFEDWECDHCGHTVYGDEDTPSQMLYCPHCGWKMK